MNFGIGLTERSRAEGLLGCYRKVSTCSVAPDLLPKTAGTGIFYMAGVDRSRARSLCLVTGLASVGVIAAAIAIGFWIGIAAAVLPIGALWLFVRRWTRRRAERFEHDYTALLLSLASAVRTGLDPLSALTESKALFQTDSLVREAITEFAARIDRGETEATAIARFADAIAHPDLALFRTALILARKEGSSLSECLQRLARVTRQRQSFRRKVRAAVAMQKLSAFGIAGCTVVIGIIQGVTNSDALAYAIHHPTGGKVLALGLSLILLGLTWMLRLSAAEGA